MIEDIVGLFGKQNIGAEISRFWIIQTTGNNFKLSHSCYNKIYFIVSIEFKNSGTGFFSILGLYKQCRSRAIKDMCVLNCNVYTSLYKRWQYHVPDVFNSIHEQTQVIGIGNIPMFLRGYVNTTKELLEYTIVNEDLNLEEIGPHSDKQIIELKRKGIKFWCLDMILNDFPQFAIYLIDPKNYKKIESEFKLLVDVSVALKTVEIEFPEKKITVIMSLQKYEDWFREHSDRIKILGDRDQLELCSLALNKHEKTFKALYKKKFK